MNTCAGVGTDKEKRKCQSSLLGLLRHSQSMAAPWQACSDAASSLCWGIALFLFSVLSTVVFRKLMLHLIVGS